MHYLRPSWHRSLLLVLAFMAALALVVGVRSAPSTLPSATAPTSTPVPAAVGTPPAAAVHGFPVYPGATFMKTEVVPPCQGQVSGFSVCDATTFTWQTGDDGDAVVRWYQHLPASSGWSCGEGPGDYASPRSFLLKSPCLHEAQQYVVFFQAEAQHTLITLVIAR